DVGDLWDVGGEQIDVVEGEADGRAGLLAAGLHGGAHGNHNHEFGSEVGKNVGASAAEAISVGKEHDDGGDAPGHAEDGSFGNEPRRIEAAGTVVIAEQRHKAASQGHADEPADQGEQNPFGEKLQQDAAVSGAES